MQVALTSVRSSSFKNSPMRQLRMPESISEFPIEYSTGRRFESCCLNARNNAEKSYVVTSTDRASLQMFVSAQDSLANFVPLPP